MKANPVQKTIGGVTFEDRFAHLQEDTDESLAWQWERDALAQAAAEASPNYAPVRERLRQLGDTGGLSVPRKRGSLWFALGKDGEDSVLRVGDAPDGQGRIIVSARDIACSHGTGAVFISPFFEPSPKGRFVAVPWGADGDMIGLWSIYETASGRHVRDAKGILFTGARPGWLPDDSGFWLDDRTEDGLHRLRFVPAAVDATDGPEVVLPAALVAGKHSGLTLQVSPDGARGVVVTEPHEHVALVHLDLGTSAFRSFLPDGFEGECDGSWIDGETYVARITDGGSRGSVVAIPASTSQDRSSWRELVPEGEGFLAWAGVVAGRLYVGDLVDVSLRVRVFDLDGKLIETLPLENPGSSPSMWIERAIRPTDCFAITHGTFTRSPVLFVHDADSGELRQVGAAKHVLEDVTAERRFATSRDGTRIPYYVVRRKDVAAAQPQPTLVYAYGGFNVSLLPTFPAIHAPFIEAGGTFVQASLRGGAEYGRAWHDGGRLLAKRNTFDDLEAVAEALVADGVAATEAMAFQGASNGGMLAGAAIVFQPHLWRAVAPCVPIFDIMEMLPLRPDTAAIRAIMYEDYGDPTIPEVAQSVIQWSPYHNIRDGIAYPAVYQVFGEFDVGCMPFHGRKFTARLEEANVGDRPIHLRVWRNVGHGTNDPAYNAQWLAFVMDQVGLQAAGARA
jgi:prolyl oligopeptidase